MPIVHNFQEVLALWRREGIKDPIIEDEGVGEKVPQMGRSLEC
jgi:hypothetical protein